MNEWGIPDWRDAESYGDTEEWSRNRWRWEFFRRRADLRECFDAHADQTYRENKKFAGKPWFPSAHLKPHEPGFAAIVDEENVKRFGYANLPNPRIGDQPWDRLNPNVTDGMVKGIPLNQSADAVDHLLDLAGVQVTTEQAAFLRANLSGVRRVDENEVTLAFDLDRPLEPQIKTARQSLRFHQAARHGRKVQKRRQPKRWLAYLRTLDAREAGASWSEIADLFYRQGLLDRRKNPAGGYSAPPPQAARDMWEAANALRFNF